LREHARRAAGGWFSLMMAAIYACIMMLWQWGSTRKHAFFDSHSVPLESFLRMSEQARRRPPLLGVAARRLRAQLRTLGPEPLGQSVYVACDAG